MDLLAKDGPERDQKGRGCDPRAAAPYGPPNSLFRVLLGFWNAYGLAQQVGPYLEMVCFVIWPIYSPEQSSSWAYVRYVFCCVSCTL
jgi:hypothetical protein